MTAEEILTAARAKITPPGSWTQGHYALDEKGELAWPTSPEACRFCARGAIMAVADRDDPDAPAVKSAIERLRKHASIKGTVTRTNDSSKTTHAKVLAWFDRAIRAEKAARGEKVRV